VGGGVKDVDDCPTRSGAIFFTHVGRRMAIVVECPIVTSPSGRPTANVVVNSRVDRLHSV
jgi:hypothetical protein